MVAIAMVAMLMIAVATRLPLKDGRVKCGTTNQSAAATPAKLTDPASTRDVSGNGSQQDRQHPDKTSVLKIDREQDRSQQGDKGHQEVVAGQVADRGESQAEADDGSYGRLS
jgi:hypothetical protein